MSRITLNDTTTYSGNTGVWNFDFTNVNDIIISQSNATISIPSIKCQVNVPKITGNASNTTWTISRCIGYLSGNSYNFNDWSAIQPMSPSYQGDNYATIFNTSNISISANNFFNSNNKTTKTIPIKIIFSDLRGLRRASATYGRLQYNSATDITTLCNLTLNAPPVIENFTVTSDISKIYAGINSITLQATNVIANYGGDITNVVFKIGADTEQITPVDNQTIFTANIIPTSSGTFTPTVTITDSRGQITTQSLNTTIIVNEYAAPSIEIIDVERTFGEYQLTEDTQIEDLTKKYYERSGEGTTANPFIYVEVDSPASNPSAARYYELTNNKGLEDDEGTSAVIEIIPTYTSDIAYLEAPILQINNETSISINPPITWYGDRNLTTVINWTQYKPSADTHLYGYITDIFDTQSSYEIGLIPQDSIGTGSIVSQNLAPAFYTIDFLAGGHGIAFGQPCYNEGFYCNMDAYFKDTVGIMRAMFNLMHPIGSYYETSLPTTPISGHSVDDNNLTDEEIADCGISWFDPRVMWGGTWISETTKDVYVVDEGTVSDWTYKKWSDGTAECWKLWSSSSFSPSTAVGGFYGRVLPSSGYTAFPSGLFISTPIVNFTLDSWGTGYFWASARQVTVDGVKMTLFRNDNAASAATGSFHVIGNWKTYTAPATKYKWHRTA